MDDRHDNESIHVRSEHTEWNAAPVSISVRDGEFQVLSDGPADYIWRS